MFFTLWVFFVIVVVVLLTKPLKKFSSSGINDFVYCAHHKWVCFSSPPPCHRSVSNEFDTASYFERSEVLFPTVKKTKHP